MEKWQEWLIIPMEKWQKHVIIPMGKWFNMKRKITDKLIEWANTPQHKPILIEGARQVGKTYSILSFISENYHPDNVFHMDLMKRPKLCSLFDDDFDIEVFKANLKLVMRHKTFAANKTVLFIDEIQVCPRAITLLKYLDPDHEWDVIASGSLLGVAYAKVNSFPVGYIDRLTLRPLDFEEFLWALDFSESITERMDMYLSNHRPFETVVHEVFLYNFTLYVAIGGMPEVVKTYLDTKDYDVVLEKQKALIHDIRSDIAKYAEKPDRSKVKEVFMSLPTQLAKDYKKFQFKLVSKNGRGRLYDGSIQWLIDAGIVIPCHNLSAIEHPFSIYQRLDAFKLYLFDIGLLVAMLGVEAQTEILLGNLGVSKGAIYENVVANLLINHHDQLYYFERNSTLEIDFIILREHKKTAIEVKSSLNTKSKSLNVLLKEGLIEKGIRLSTKNLTFSTEIESIPLYLAGNI